MAAASAIWYQNNFDDLFAIACTLVDKKSMLEIYGTLNTWLTGSRIHTRLDKRVGSDT